MLFTILIVGLWSGHRNAHQKKYACTPHTHTHTHTHRHGAPEKHIYSFLSNSSIYSLAAYAWRSHMTQYWNDSSLKMSSPYMTVLFLHVGILYTSVMVAVFSPLLHHGMCDWYHAFIDLFNYSLFNAYLYEATVIKSLFLLCSNNNSGFHAVPRWTNLCPF